MKIGIIGVGQLARMLSIAGTPLGLEFYCLGKTGDCAEEVVKSVTDIDLEQINDVVTWAKQFDVITFENENISHELIKAINHNVNVYPSAKAIAISQDRLLEKSFMQDHGIATAKFVNIDSLDKLEKAVQDYGIPAIVKIRRFGYDGKGQFVMKSQEDVSKAWDTLKNAPDGLIYEAFVDFDYEVSQICTADIKGNIAFYPLAKNIHKQGIIVESEAPFENLVLAEKAQQIAKTLVKEFAYVGTLAIEFFVKGDELIVNEIAPRVHNSGHWSIDGSITSQFENHVRAITGLILGDTTSRKTVMLNCIGGMPATKDLAALDRVKIHSYNKEPRKGRKVGHLNLNLNDETDAYQLLQAKKLIELSQEL
ncbi:5-(carboxyamino)imidazole ribonucleotide synthase [Francisella noatunensis]|uniref:N5-carboxyaminoimidazole ribonucleotide synthase n=1 Tax=Francisella noatunensis TaxID=657445 RepID=A0A9Q2QCJ6_9GAMM|nr:5-(carboxyamino)imidazole ribonucleotide synthase [Francisella noatunensis]MBK2029449.1 5-(carboxyamino)imidazole ribonucleotide synthase [Francisella noatunensis]MBK2033641.1 5-(carboxyamino)imidazole ribonucleotide synthase [Francisella noatunensis]MBK2048636.1 5-(carboxyamino)imidazole ribonucleotide synthase [Francisella noatunensis]MBK2050563.1 5-(carboxyamino)imidazole ribonucleotide synthase [Francisella noatunensis]MBK2051830.1 5-(carboxyamino)imidazole ribonucleotide synthase [Fran